MNDLIERQVAIDAIFSEPLYESGMKKRDADAVVPAIYEKIKSLPSAQPEQRWIPVAERLPEEDGTYIVSGVWGSGKKQVGECKFYVHDGCFSTSWYFDVKAWMPLPEPYKEE